MDTALRDIRDAYFDAIYEIGARRPEVVIITNDMDVFSLRRFKDNFADRFINIGVAEQNMINVAAGLASCGKRPLLFGILSFVVYRCYEQIRFNAASMNLPIVIAGIGAGFAFSFDGPTHHGVQDIAAMRAIPGMTIYNPGDTVSAAACAHLSMNADGPVFVRVDRGMFPALHEPKTDFSKGFGILRPLTDLNILATGYMTREALVLADKLAAEGIAAGVVDVFRLHPLPGDAFVHDVLSASRKIVTLEENSLTGGLGTALAEAIVDSQSGCRLLRLASTDAQTLAYGSREWLLARSDLTLSRLAERVRAFAR